MFAAMAMWMVLLLLGVTTGKPSSSEPLCTCQPGYQLPGSKFIDVDECATNGGQGPCDPHHGVCRNSPGSYSCWCQTGFELEEDRHTCKDVDECATNYGQGPCDPYNGICHDVMGNYRCLCRNGFELGEDRHTCKDVDECLANGGRGPCDHICTDMLGSYRCSCRDGYELGSDGLSCVDTNACRINPCENGGTYHEGNGGYLCECPSGFKGVNCEFAPCSENFTPPQHGSVTCGDVSTGGRFCTVACNSQHEFACRPADGYSCDVDGNWNLLGRSTCDADELPGDAPWPDCSRMHLAWWPQVANADYYYDGDCQSNVAEIIQMFDSLFNTLGGAATSGSGTSNIENINVACGETTRSSGNRHTSEGGLEQLIAKLCENQPDGSLQPHPYDCSMYIQCHQAGHDAVFSCPPGTRWSQELQTCARADLVTCD